LQWSARNLRSQAACCPSTQSIPAITGQFSRRWAGFSSVSLTTDPLLSLACTLLDWSGRSFEVPSSYHYKLEDSRFEHNWDSLKRSMSANIVPDDSGGFNSQEVLYRDIFDHLFTYLDRLNHYVEIKLVNAKDLRILRYYLQEVVSPRLADHQPIFNDFIEEFGYEGVFRLCKKLRVSR